MNNQKPPLPRKEIAEIVIKVYADPNQTTGFSYNMSHPKDIRFALVHLMMAGALMAEKNIKEEDQPNVLKPTPFAVAKLGRPLGP